MMCNKSTALRPMREHWVHMGSGCDVTWVGRHYTVLPEFMEDIRHANHCVHKEWACRSTSNENRAMILLGLGHPILVPSFEGASGIDGSVSLPDATHLFQRERVAKSDNTPVWTRVP